jgi:hypothetical protein
MRFEVLTATNMKMTEFWVVAPRSLVEVYDVSEVLVGPTGSHIKNRFLALGLLIALMMEGASTSETSSNFYHTT